MKIVFLGNPEFSAAVLHKLVQSFKVDLVVTGADKKRGRGGAASASPLRALAEKLSIPVICTESVSKEKIEEIRALAPDIAVTAAFGQILSGNFLKIPKHGVLNVHASLLPKYRGSAPVQWALINGETETGVTIMRTVRAVDAGDILLQKWLKIREGENAGVLLERLSELGGDAIVEALKLIEAGKAEYTPQNEAEATHFPMLKKEDGLIDFNKTPKEISDFVRGMTPWPSAYTFAAGKLLKVLETEAVELCASVASATVLTASPKEGLIVAARGGAVRLKTVQRENGKMMSGRDYLMGQKVEVGSILGNRP